MKWCDGCSDSLDIGGFLSYSIWGRCEFCYNNVASSGQRKISSNALSKWARSSRHARSVVAAAARGHSPEGTHATLRFAYVNIGKNAARLRWAAILTEDTVGVFSEINQHSLPHSRFHRVFKAAGLLTGGAKVVGGVAIYMPNFLQVKKVIRDQCGRWLVLRGTTFDVCAAYIPAITSAKCGYRAAVQHFLHVHGKGGEARHIPTALVRHQVPQIWMGDFNGLKPEHPQLREVTGAQPRTDAVYVSRRRESPGDARTAPRHAAHQPQP
eukprot:scaffold2842_cov277-Pinguiococcus_pyrenoidosus.AAC.3